MRSSEKEKNKRKENYLISAVMGGYNCRLFFEDTDSCWFETAP
jgi:hypothetical protein